MEEELDKNAERDMTPRLLEDLGMRFPVGKSIKKYRYGLYEFQYCKKEFNSIIYSIKRKDTISCGCQKDRIIREQHLINISHGMTKHKFYKKWSQMLRRCTNPKDAAYKDYGARGITVCEEWLDPKTFLDWCDLTFPNIEGHTLDRIDNDKGYYPENCRWTDRAMQSINQRMQKNNTSGFVGVYRDKNKNRWTTNIKINNISTHLGSFKTIEEAVLARDNYIIENKLPHKLSTDYKREA